MIEEQIMNTKKLLVVGLIASALLSAQPRQSQAVIGIFTGGAAPVIGAVLLGVGVVSGVPTISALLDCYDNHGFSDCGGNATAVGVSVALGAWGLIFLDANAQPTIQYQALNADQGAKLGLTAPELLAYNDERLEIQAVSDRICAETSEQSKLDADSDHLSVFAHARWSDYSTMLSPDAFSALQTIVGQIK
jgi:hypothetical protein